MAIRKCPYCKAIIEEGAEFCSNCGTQLLFPEDDKIDEEIPGEKIVDDVTDDDDDDEEIELPEEEKDANPDAGDLLKSDEEEEPPLVHEEEADDSEPVENETEKSVDFQDAKEDQEPGEEIQEKKDDSDDIKIEEKEVLSEVKEDEPDVEEVLSEEKIPEVEPVEISLEDIDEKKDIKELEEPEKKVESSDFEKQEIDRFIDSMRKDQGKDVKEPLHEELVEEEPVIEEPIEEELSEEKIIEDSPSLSSTPPIFKKQSIVSPTDDLPAWATKINEKPPSSIPMTESEKELVPQEKMSTLDTGMGLPEVVSQKDLPFSGETIEAEEEKTKEPASPLSTWLKSRIFDVLFIGAVWFVTTWIASYVMEVKLFKLISVAALLLLAFYVVLLSAYLFLFYFFLGETLGDYLFNPDRRAGADHLT